MGTHRQGHGSGGKIEPSGFAAVEPAQRPDKHPDLPENHQAVVTGEAGEVEQRGRKGQQGGGDQGTAFAQAGPQPPGRGDHADPSEGHGQAGLSLAVAKKKIRGQSEDVESRPVVDRVVAIRRRGGPAPAAKATSPGVEAPARPGMDALVVVHGHRAQPPQVGDHAEDNECEVGDKLPTEPREIDGALEGRRRGPMGKGVYCHYGVTPSRSPPRPTPSWRANSGRTAT